MKYINIAIFFLLIIILLLSLLQDGITFQNG